MKNGQCPKCGSTEVRFKKRGLEPSGKGMMVSLSNPGSMLVYSNPAPLDAYICTTCGYTEMYIGDAGLLAQVAARWERVKG